MSSKIIITVVSTGKRKRYVDLDPEEKREYHRAARARHEKKKRKLRKSAVKAPTSEQAPTDPVPPAPREEVSDLPESDL
jgi:hypothetical protein